MIIYSLARSLTYGVSFQLVLWYHRFAGVTAENQCVEVSSKTARHGYIVRSFNLIIHTFWIWISACPFTAQWWRDASHGLFVYNSYETIQNKQGNIKTSQQTNSRDWYFVFQLTLEAPARIVTLYLLISDTPETVQVFWLWYIKTFSVFSVVSCNMHAMSCSIMINAFAVCTEVSCTDVACMFCLQVDCSVPSQFWPILSTTYFFLSL